MYFYSISKVCGTKQQNHMKWHKKISITAVRGAIFPLLLLVGGTLTTYYLPVNGKRYHLPVSGTAYHLLVGGRCWSIWCNDKYDMAKLTICHR